MAPGRSEAALLGHRGKPTEGLGHAGPEVGAPVPAREQRADDESGRQRDLPAGPDGQLPAGAPQATTSGILHLAFGLVQFVALAAAALVVGGWFARRGDRTMARFSRISGAVVLAGFTGGAALSTLPIGVGLPWLAVVTGWAWLLVASVQAYRTVPHPDAHRQAAATA